MTDRSSAKRSDRASNGRVPRPATTEGDERLRADRDQTRADSDQTLSDTDQTSSDSDQTSAESDQLAADRDQAASDHDLVAGVDPEVYEFSRDIRQRTAHQRGRSSRARLVAADKRDGIAEARDLAALARDQAADARDQAMAASDDAFAHEDGARALTGGDVLMRAAALRRRAAQQRLRAAEQRVLAAEDRRAAARDRQQAEAERKRAHVDRESLARELAIAETDVLTRTRTRAAGLIDLEHELDRCRRGRGLLVVAYVDVVGLKAVNDCEGHEAGDQLLVRVVQVIKEHLRSYDLMMRLGGDEFLCAMSGMTLLEARRRFGAIADALAGAGAITSGFAQLDSEDTVVALIARADGELMRNRRTHGDSRPPAAGDRST